MTKIYSLRCDTSIAYNKKNLDHDGRIVGEKFGKASYTTELTHIPPWSKINPDETVSFITDNEERLSRSHYPVVDTNLDILSLHLIETIESVGPVNWTLKPVIFTDRQGENVSADRFKVAYSNEHCDCFDYEQSEYKMRDWSASPQDRVTERMRKLASIVKKLVLREPENGFPPFFRILADPMDLYISEACHDAIADAGHTGLSMLEIGEF